MSETTSSSEPATGPVASAAPPAYAEPPRRNRLTTVAGWVGIVAGVVFIVAVVFFTGFFLGAHSGGGHRGWHHGGRDFAIMHQGPGMFPRSQGGEFGRMGPGMQPPSSPTTPTPRP